MSIENLATVGQVGCSMKEIASFLYHKVGTSKIDFHAPLGAFAL